MCYIHYNPVKRGLVARAEEWAWSSARWYSDRQPGIVTVSPLPGGSAILESAIASSLAAQPAVSDTRGVVPGVAVPRV